MDLTKHWNRSEGMPIYNPWTFPTIHEDFGMVVAGCNISFNGITYVLDLTEDRWPRWLGKQIDVYIQCSSHHSDTILFTEGICNGMLQTKKRERMVVKDISLTLTCDGQCHVYRWSHFCPREPSPEEDAISTSLKRALVVSQIYRCMLFALYSYL